MYRAASIAGLIVALVAAGCSREDTVKIGLASPITGPQAHIGVDRRVPAITDYLLLTERVPTVEEAVAHKAF